MEAAGRSRRSRARDRAIVDDAGLAAEAERIGFPLLIKASAGGGGKGMSRVDRAEDLPAALAEGRRVAGAAFGDGTVYLERLLEGCRHVEFQVFGDSAGNVVHLFERECSVQRRHQKIVEETPSPALVARPARGHGESGGGRRRGPSATSARARSSSSSTATGGFYFLEMNTRLQVEHAITEETLGCDLVRAQLEVAQGAPLPAGWRDGALAPRGHAIELRLYAEDPVDFLPRSGRILAYREPAGPGIRVDAGVEEGSVVGVEYDPLLAKLIVCGAGPRRGDRAARAGAPLGVGRPRRRDEPGAARRRARVARSSSPAATRRTSSARLPPGAGAPEPPDAAWIAAALARLRFRGAAAGRGRAGAGAAGSVGRPARLEGRSRERVRLRSRGRGARGPPRGRASLVGDRASRSREASATAGRRLAVEAAAIGSSRRATGDRIFVWCDGDVVRVRTRCGRCGPRRASSTAADLLAPMPGRVRQVFVAAGERVERGSVLLVLEAMKMEHAIRAPRDGVVRSGCWSRKATSSRPAWSWSRSASRRPAGG